MKLGYLAIDQYGDMIRIRDDHPRKWLMKSLGRRRADEMYADSSDDPVHVGYVIAGRWLRVYEVHSWDKKKT